MHIWDSSTRLCMGYGTKVTLKACGSLVCFYQTIKYIFINLKIDFLIWNDADSGVWFGYSFKLYSTAGFSSSD